jgi:hypothetical protein
MIFYLPTTFKIANSALIVKHATVTNEFHTKGLGSATATYSDPFTQYNGDECQK